MRAFTNRSHRSSQLTVVGLLALALVINGPMATGMSMTDTAEPDSVSQTAEPTPEVTATDVAEPTPEVTAAETDVPEPPAEPAAVSTEADPLEPAAADGGQAPMVDPVEDTDESAPADDQAPMVDPMEDTDESGPAPTEEPAPAEASASVPADATDGAPVEEFVPGIKVVPGDQSATIYWPDFGAEDVYVVQFEQSDGTWKTVEKDVEPADLTGVEGPVAPVDHQATVEDLVNGETYTGRIVSADTLADAYGSTADAVDLTPGGPRGSMASGRITAPADGRGAVSSTSFIVPLASSTSTDIVVNVRTTAQPLGTGGSVGVDYAGTVGARFELYTYTTANAGPQSPTGFACTVVSGGSCTINVTGTGSGGTNNNKQFWVVQTAAASGFYWSDFFMTGSAFGPTNKHYYPGLTQPLTPNTTQTMPGTSTPLPQNDRSFGATANARANPELAPKCTAGLNVALIMDLSSSVDDDERDVFRQAIVGPGGLFDSLTGSNSSIAIFTFGANTPAAGTTNYPVPLPLDTNRTVLNDRIDVTTDGTQYTNWDRGLRNVADQPYTYDVALFITDGAPNYIATTGGGSVAVNGSDVTVRSLEAAIYSANAVKAGNTRVLGVGVGDAISADILKNLRAVSGADKDDDYYLAANWDLLKQQLRNIAFAATCQVPIQVTKLVLDQDGANPTPDNGWTITTVPSSVSPETTTATLSPADTSQVTAGSGANAGQANWSLRFTEPTGTATLTISEDAASKPGYSFVGGTCTITHASGPPTEVTMTGPSVVLTEVKANDRVECEVRNQPIQGASLDIEKETVGGTGTFAYSVDGSGLAGFNRNTAVNNPTQNNPFEFSAAQFGTKYVQETTQSGWTLTGLSCTAGGAEIVIGTGIGGTFNQGATAGFDPGDTTVKAVIGAGDIPSCTFTNTKLGSITIIKDADPKDGTDFAFTTTGADLSGFTLDNDTDSTNSDRKVFSGLLPGTRTVTETGVAGWNLTDLQCVGGGTTNLGTRTATINLPAGGNVTCTFTNTKLGSITIIKDADPKDGTDFAFTTTGADLSGFTLDNDTDSTNSDRKVFSGLLPGTRTVTETGVAGWNLTDLQCVGGGTTNLGTRTATINLPAGGNVTCTFTNTKLGSITIIKDADPKDGTDFAFTTTGADLSGFTLDNDTDSTNSDRKVFSGLLPGTRTVTETGVAGWNLTDLQCVGGGTTNLGTRTATINLPAGGNVTCTFTNTKLGSITIIKDADPKDGTDFAFTTTGADLSGFTLDNDTDSTNSDRKVFSGLLPGTRTVTETGVAGWNLTDLQCVGGGTTNLGTRTATINLPAGGNVTCTFTNTKLGSITIIKDADPKDGTDFAFTTTGADLSGFTLDNDTDSTNSDRKVFSGLLPGTRTVTETGVAGWNLTDLQCVGGGTTNLGTRTATINLPAGGNVTCTFTNTKLGSITIIKDADPKDGTDFAFTTTGADLSGFTLDNDTDSTNSDRKVFSGLLPGTRTVTETGVAGWNLTDLQCVGGGTTNLGTRTATINLPAGGNVTCTFTNTKLGSITIIKDADPKDGTDFAFTTTGADLSGFTLDNDTDSTNSDRKVFSGLLPGTRTVTETGVAGWNLTDLQCVGGGTTNLGTRTATINLPAGGNVTCTFTNTKLGSITIIKDADPKDGTDFAFTTTGADLSGFTLDNDTDSTNSDRKVFSGLLPGTRTVTETGVAGWNLTDLQCVGGGPPTWAPARPRSTCPRAGT